eukprot:g57205.t1
MCYGIGCQLLAMRSHHKPFAASSKPCLSIASHSKPSQAIRTQRKAMRSHRNVSLLGAGRACRAFPYPRQPAAPPAPVPLPEREGDTGAGLGVFS